MPELNMQSDSRQIPKVKSICASKKYYDILYSYLQYVSERDKEKDIRYFKKEDINFSKLADYFGVSRQTLSTKFKYLKELGLVEEIDKKTFKLVKLDKDLASLVDYRLLKLMNDTLNENTINAYVYLFNRYYANGFKSFQFGLDNIKEFIGLSVSSRNNNDIITNILFVLQKIGLIKYSLVAVPQDSSNFNNIKTIYQLDWMTNKFNDVKKC